MVMMTMMINWEWEVGGTALVSFTNSSTVFGCRWCWTFLFHCRRLVSFIARYGPRRGGATGRLQIWPPLKSIFFKYFWPGTGLVKIFEGASPICRFSFSCGILSLLIHHDWLFQGRLSAPYSLALWTSVINRMHHHSFFVLSVFFNFSLNHSFQEDLFAGNRACNQKPVLRGHSQDRQGPKVFCLK